MEADDPQDERTAEDFTAEAPDVDFDAEKSAEAEAPEYPDADNAGRPHDERPRDSDAADQEIDEDEEKNEEGDDEDGEDEKDEDEEDDEDVLQHAGAALVAVEVGQAAPAALSQVRHDRSGGPRPAARCRLHPGQATARRGGRL